MLIGIDFPWQADGVSFPRIVTEDDVIKASILQIMGTSRGERVKRPTLGANALSYIFENTDVAAITTERDLRLSLSKWEPRVRVDEIVVDQNNPSFPGSMVVTVYYTRVATGNQDQVSLVGVAK